MFGLSFLAPLFLLGLATAAIPVVIHLIHRRRSRQIPYSTLMFLRLAHQRTARRRRLRELVMLLLRCAILALLALAFADPHYAGAMLRGGRAGVGESVCAAIVVDDSFSMGYRHGGATSFDRARDAAAAIIQGLPRGSEAALLFTCANAEWEIVEPTPNLLQLKRSAQSAAVSAEAGPLVPALMRADALWPAENPRPREVYVLTDLQRSAWQSADSFAEAASALPALSAMNVAVVDCGAERAENTAVGDVAAKRTAGAATPSLAITARVHNFGREARELALALRTGAGDTQLRATEQVSVPEAGVAQVAFKKGLDDAGPISGQVCLPADALSVDDTHYFVLRGQSQPRVLLVSEENVQSLASDLFYVHAALALGSAPFDTFAVSPDELAGMRLDDVRVIIAGRMPGLSPNGAGVLREFVSGGGGLLLLVGPGVPLSEYNELLAPSAGAASDSSGQTILPARLADVVETAEDQRLTWEHIDLTHPVFEVFAGICAKELGFVRTKGYVAVEIADADTGPPRAVAAPQSRVRILARYSDGGAAIVESAVGAGRAILFTTPCDGMWSNLPLRASFVPIVHRAVAYLAEEDAVPIEQHFVGQPIERSFPPDAGAVSVHVVGPDGKDHVAVSEVKDGQNRAAFRETHVPGVYAVSADVSPNDASSRIAVNVDLAESDLARLSAQQLERLVPNARLRTPAEFAGYTYSKAAGRNGKGNGMRLWAVLIIILVAASLSESLLASLFSPRQGIEAVRARSFDFAKRRVPTAPSPGDADHA